MEEKQLEERKVKALEGIDKALDILVFLIGIPVFILVIYSVVKLVSFF